MYCKHSKNYSLANPSVLSPIRNASYSLMDILMIICLWGAIFSILISKCINMNLFRDIKSVFMISINQLVNV